jgi:tetratricopeptide (TPR) repeat protein
VSPPSCTFILLSVLTPVVVVSLYRFGIGNVYAKTGKYRLAEYHFRKAAEINPTNAMLICCVGTVLEKLGKRREALDAYDNACQLAPHSPAVRFKRVCVLFALKQYQVQRHAQTNTQTEKLRDFVLLCSWRYATCSSSKTKRRTSSTCTSSLGGYTASWATDPR